MKKFLGIALACALALSSAGCKDPYGASVKTANSIASGIGQAELDVDQLAKAGLFNPAEEKAVLDYLNFANSLNGQFQSCVSNVHAASGKASQFVACVTVFNQGLSNPAELAKLHVVNPKAQAKVQTVVAAIQIGLNTLDINLGGAGQQVTAVK